MIASREDVRVRIGGAELVISVCAADGDPRGTERTVPLDAALEGIDATCRAVLHALTRLLPAETELAVTAGFTAKAGALLASLTFAFVTEALALEGIEASEAERHGLVAAAAEELARYTALRAIDLADDVPLPSCFSPLVPGMVVERVARPSRPSARPAVARPADLAQAAFWPVRHLAELIRTRQVSSVELTAMSLARLRRENVALNGVVTFLDTLALSQAAHADAEIAAGRYRGPLHGIPWGAKDLIAVEGHPTTWGTAAFQTRVIDQNASVVDMLRDAGAVLVAKLSTGELAAGDRWFGGRTNNPWQPSQGASGSSAGSAAMTASGGVGFALGTETYGSILSPAARCGVVGLRPTFGLVSRHGVMSLSWTLDRVGPICRSVEDCALVLQAIAKPDGRDMSVADVPFTWDAGLDVTTLRVGCLHASFDELIDPVERANAARVLDLLRTLGVRRLIPVTVPTFEAALIGLGVDGVEGAAFFDGHIRRGDLRDPRRGRQFARLIPAVEYLQAQRLRTVMMRDLAAATQEVDVYLAAPADAGPDVHGDAIGSDPLRAARRHAEMACLAGYPAVAVPSGFSAAGTPTSITFFARPFGDAKLLALARAYEEARGPLARPSCVGT